MMLKTRSHLNFQFDVSIQKKFFIGIFDFLHDQREILNGSKNEKTNDGENRFYELKEINGRDEIDEPMEFV